MPAEDFALPYIPIRSETIFCSGNGAISITAAAFSSMTRTRYRSPLYDSDISRQIDHLLPIWYDMYDLAHAAGCEPYSLHGLARVSWVGSAPWRSCTTSRNGRYGINR